MKKTIKILSVITIGLLAFAVAVLPVICIIKNANNRFGFSDNFISFAAAFIPFFNKCVIGVAVCILLITVCQKTNRYFPEVIMLVALNTVLPYLNFLFQRAVQNEIVSNDGYIMTVYFANQNIYQTYSLIIPWSTLISVVLAFSIAAKVTEKKNRKNTIKNP